MRHHTCQNDPSPPPPGHPRGPLAAGYGLCPAQQLTHTSCCISVRGSNEAAALRSRRDGAKDQVARRLLLAADCGAAIGGACRQTCAPCCHLLTRSTGTKMRCILLQSRGCDRGRGEALQDGRHGKAWGMLTWKGTLFYAPPYQHTLNNTVSCCVSHYEPTEGPP